MNFSYVYVAALVLLLISSDALSAETLSPEKKLTEKVIGSWHGNAELGVVNTTGNTKTETINAKAKFQIEEVNWRHTVTYESLTSSDQGVTTAERYVLNGQTDYKFGAHNYFFMMLNYEDDRFSGYEHRLSEAMGYGRRFIDEVVVTLDLEIGPGARQSKRDDGSNEDEVTLRGAAKLAWKLSNTSSITEDLFSEFGEDTTITKSVTALTAQINGSLATKITYTIKNTSKVPVGVHKTDTETAVTLVYSFK